MSADAFRKLKDWLTLGEAASELAVTTGDSVSEAQVLRLAVDGFLTLSLYLPLKIVARCQRLDDDSEDPPETEQRIEGLWDVPMFGRGKLQIEHQYHWLNGQFVPMNGPVGAFVEKDGLLCRVPPDHGQSGFSTRPASEFPQGSVLCVRRAALEQFIREHVTPAPKEVKIALEKPLGERERATLLVIIAALAKEANLDVNMASKAGATIEALTEALGARVAARTVELHLKRIPEALERRGADAD